MKLDDIDRWINQITDVIDNPGAKLKKSANLDLVMGKKLSRLAGKVDKLADVATGTVRKFDRLADKVDGLADVATGTEQKIDRVANKVDKLADVATGTGQKLERLAELSTSTEQNNGKREEVSSPANQEQDRLAKTPPRREET